MTTTTTSILDSAESFYGGERYDLVGKTFTAQAWNMHGWEGTRSFPQTCATAWIPVDSPGWPDGKVLVSRIVMDGHGHHAAMLEKVIARAEQELAFLSGS